jgi:hypothetical protein
MDSIDKIVLRMVSTGTGGTTVIVCLFTGSGLPSACAPMPRRPAPETGMPFDITFSDVFAEATRLNPAIHDGAVMVGRRRVAEPYKIVGWSFRLFPSAEIQGPANRGSAFNSAQAMSRVPTIDAVYWVSGRDIYRFRDGASFEVSH